MLDKLLNEKWWLRLLADAQRWADRNILDWAVLIQLGVVILAALLAWLLSSTGRKHVEAWAEKSHDRVQLAVRTVKPLIAPIIWLGLMWFAVVVAEASKWPHRLMTLVVSLLTAWIVIRLAVQLLRNRALARVVAAIAWSVAALNIVGLLDPTLKMLDTTGVSLGEVRISALAVLKGAALLAILLWAATLAARLLESRVNKVESLTPSVRVLISKGSRILLIILAITMALGSVGIDLTAFAVFSGAVGVGVGFGLQKVVSNLISGVILLLDRSIKPGDVIAVKDTYGWINSMNARYASVVTRDGTEHLLPNELLITEPVENWTHSNSRVRLKIPFGVSYNEDPHRVVKIALEAAAAKSRVLSQPAPKCLLREFGDNSVNLELRIWIADSQNGVSNIKSDVMLELWDRLRDAGVEIPFPQRDIHVKSWNAAIPSQADIEDREAEERAERMARAKEAAEAAEAGAGKDTGDAPKPGS